MRSNNLALSSFFNHALIVVRMRVLLLLSLCFFGCNPSTSTSTAENMPDNAPLSITWGVLSNVDIPNSFTSELVLTNTSQDTLFSEDWSLYFNFIRLVESHTETDRVRIEHINGDFYRLDLVDAAAPLAPKEQLSISIQAAAWAIKDSDAPSGFYMVYPREGRDDEIVPVTSYEVRPFITSKQTSRMPSDGLPVPTPESTYEANLRLTQLSEDQVSPILPSPSNLTYQEGHFSIDASTSIYYQEGLEQQATFLMESLSSIVGTPLQTQPLDTSNPRGIVLIEQLLNAGQEAYELNVTSEGITVAGGSAQGVFYGIQTLRALISPASYTSPSEVLSIPAMSVQDQPRFSYRGMHLDVSRNFHPVESVKKLLDVMAFYKLNKFHFHLTDDEGWRLEIPGLPELTLIGGRRGHTLDEQDHLIPALGSGPYVDLLPGSGFYTRNEYIDILQYAKERHIEVIPEVDVPGHARAAIVAMKARHRALSNQGQTEEANRYLLSHPEDTSTYMSVQLWNDNVIDVCMPSTYTFLEKVFDEVRLMHEEAGTPLTTLHTGGDEVPHGVWEGSPACEQVETDNLHDYFLENVYQLLNKHNIRLAGWEEIVLTESPGVQKSPNPAFVPYQFQPYVWNNVWGWGMEDMAYKLANAGYPVVLSNATNLYFDLSYDKSPEEPGYYWASFVDTYKAFSYTPLDIFKTATNDNFGNPINRHTSYPNRVKLTRQGEQNILGLQGQLWSERAYDAEAMEYLIFPKLLGLAERAWADQPGWATMEDDAIREAQLAQAWNQFANQLGQREFHRLDGLNGGFNYRIPPPGARIIQGMLHANTAFPGLQIHYTTDGTEPSIDSPIYTAPIQVQTAVQLRIVSPTGHYSRTVTVEPTE